MEIKTGIEKWHEVDGDNTLALDWPLDENSHVWEIGGFEGRWAQQIWDKFHCHITIFEPQAWAVERMQKRFEGIEKIDIRPYGLWLDNGKQLIGNYETDGATIIPSVFRGPLSGEGDFKSYYSEIQEFPHPIDVCLMNIEGAEYYLIPLIFEVQEFAEKIENFWCQFHPQNDDFVTGATPIFNLIEQTHDLLWNCFPTAVAWRKR